MWQVCFAGLSKFLITTTRLIYCMTAKLVPRKGIKSGQQVSYAKKTNCIYISLLLVSPRPPPLFKKETHTSCTNAVEGIANGKYRYEKY